MSSGIAGITVPATTASYPYTVKASKNGSTLVTGTAVTSLAVGRYRHVDCRPHPDEDADPHDLQGCLPRHAPEERRGDGQHHRRPERHERCRDLRTAASGTTNATTGVTAAITVPAGDRVLHRQGVGQPVSCDRDEPQ